MGADTMSKPKTPTVMLVSSLDNLSDKSRYKVNIDIVSPQESTQICYPVVLGARNGTYNSQSWRKRRLHMFVDHRGRLSRAVTVGTKFINVKIEFNK
jgi:hypothetical protein